MPWAKLDDGFWMHPKTLAAGNEVAGIFARCLSYCGAYLTDGRVPKDVATMIAGNPKALKRTVDAGFLDELPATGDYYISDYAHYNPLRDEVEAERAKRQDRARKGAAARWKGESPVRLAHPDPGP